MSYLEPNKPNVIQQFFMPGNAAVPKAAREQYKEVEAQEIITARKVKTVHNLQRLAMHSIAEVDQERRLLSRTTSELGQELLIESEISYAMSLKAVQRDAFTREVGK